MFQLAYGYRLQGTQDPFFQDMRKAVHRGLDAVMFTSKLGTFIRTLKPDIERQSGS
jgi:hypothetical protein